MSNQQEYDKFQGLTFDKFKALAKDESLSRYEKIGFPDSYRAGKEHRIFADITSKLQNLNESNKAVMDIGPGCSELPMLMIELCRRRDHSLILVDSEEMLSHLPDEAFIRKVAACYPRDCTWLFQEYAHSLDVVLSYSVFHYVFGESSIFDFVDRSLGLLAHRGEMLIGDIPNISKRKRFFCSPQGVRYHQEFTGSNEIPVVQFNTLEAGQIDDAVLVSIVMRCRASGFDAYLLPQPDDLAMANRREDMLIRRP